MCVYTRRIDNLSNVKETFYYRRKKKNTSQHKQDNKTNTFFFFLSRIICIEDTIKQAQLEKNKKKTI